MSEAQESIVRAQTILLLSRNYHDERKAKRIMKRFLRCVNGFC